MKARRVVWCGRLDQFAYGQHLNFVSTVKRCEHYGVFRVKDETTPAGKPCWYPSTSKGPRPCIGVPGVFTPDKEEK